MLRAEVREWLCEDCNYVYPGPPQPGFKSVICPRCGGFTGPKNAALHRIAQAEIERLKNPPADTHERDEYARSVPEARRLITRLLECHDFLAEKAGEDRNCKTVREAVEWLNEHGTAPSRGSAPRGEKP